MVREESQSVLAELKQAGVRSFALLTGDLAERPTSCQTP